MSLANLINKQKETPKDVTPDAVESVGPSQPSAADDANVGDSRPAKSGGLAFLKKAHSSESFPSGKPAQAASAAAPADTNTGKAGFSFLAKRKPGPAASGGDSKPAPVGRTGESERVVPDSGKPAGSGQRDDSSGGDAGSIESLDDLMASTLGEAAPVKNRFVDEIDAQAPIREFEGEIDKDAQKFVDSLDTIYRVLHEPDLLGGQIRNIMMELGSNPEYRKLISPKDVHTMVRGMRDSMGLARVQKTEAKAKRAGGNRKVKTDDVDTLAALKDFDFGDLG